MQTIGIKPARDPNQWFSWQNLTLNPKPKMHTVVDAVVAMAPMPQKGRNELPPLAGTGKRGRPMNKHSSMPDMSAGRHHTTNPHHGLIPRGVSDRLLDVAVFTAMEAGPSVLAPYSDILVRVDPSPGLRVYQRELEVFGNYNQSPPQHDAHGCP